MQLACMRGKRRKFDLGFIRIAGIQPKIGLPDTLSQYTVR